MEMEKVKIQRWVSFAIAFLIFCSSVFGVDRLVPTQYATIQAAIDAANAGDTVIIAPGTYTGVNNKNLDFTGKAITVRSTNPENPNVVTATIIDCENSGRGFNFHSGEGLDSILSGLTITNGNTDENSGGGIYSIDSSPTIENCIITDNTTGIFGSEGGGIYSSRGSPRISNCTITGNSAAWGGGFACGSGSPIISGCTITGNSAASSDPYMISSGGGIHAHSPGLEIKNCTISGNSAPGWGSGIECSSSCTITNCLITGNSGTREGAIACRNSDPTIRNCTISNNEGYGIYCAGSSSDPTVTNCILWNNTRGEIFDFYGNATPVVSYSDVEGGYAGTGNIDANPLFVTGPLGNYYLSQIAAGQASNSPCINTGSDTAANLEMDIYTTRTDKVWDEGIVDMGYHYSGNIADLDDNGYVNLFDFSILAFQYLGVPGAPSADIAPTGGNGIVDLLDLYIVTCQWLWEE